MSRMSRYGKFMMLANTRQNGDMRGDMGGESGVRNSYVVRNEYGARGDYNIDAKFRDRRGREHYNNGRYAPRSEMESNGDYGPRSDMGSDGGSSSSNARMGNHSGGSSRMEGNMNTIGFERPQEARSDYRMSAHHHTGNEMERGKSEKMHGGSYSMGGEFTHELAEKWVRMMKNEDGSSGEHWSMEQIKKLMDQRGVECKPHEVYATMNMLYSDFCKVFRKYGITAPEAYLELACAWLEDKDAVKDKLAMYYECIVKH